MAQKRAISPEAEDNSSKGKQGEHQIFISNSIEDRQSTFIAHFSPSSSISAKTLQTTPEFSSASHRMAAWRKASTQQTLTGAKKVYNTGYDDDGEKYGGKRLERVLVELGIEGVVVVARWYGGVMLGPVRFTHMENATKEAISAWKGSLEDDSSKRRKVEPAVDEAAEKTRLVKQLTASDQSILVLRQLLAEKLNPTLKDEPTGKEQSSSGSPSGPAKVPDYNEMALQRLKQLDKGRGATISWILKQIDQAESRKESTVAPAIEKAG